VGAVIPFCLGRQDAKNAKMGSRDQPQDYVRIRLMVGLTNVASDLCVLGVLGGSKLRVL